MHFESRIFSTSRDFYEPLGTVRLGGVQGTCNLEGVIIVVLIDFAELVSRRRCWVDSLPVMILSNQRVLFDPPAKVMRVEM
jgi:hypothetical protein